jgi:protein JSN1
LFSLLKSVVRVLTPCQCCGFVNFERLDSAVAARNALNGYEVLGSDIGPVRIGYARVQTKSPLLGGPENDGSSPQIDQVLSGLGHVQGAVSVSTEQQLSADAGGVENYRSPLVLEMVKNGIHEQVLEKGLATGGVVSEQQMIMQVLSAGRMNEDADVRASAGMSLCFEVGNELMLLRNPPASKLLYNITRSSGPYSPTGCC